MANKTQSHSIQSPVMGRRALLKSGGAALAVASLSACSASDSDSDALIPTMDEGIEPQWQAADMASQLDDLHRAVYERLPPLDYTNLEFMRSLTGGGDGEVPAEPPAEAGLSIEDYYAPGIDGAADVLLRLYRPDQLDSRAPCLYSMHGGGMIVGSIAMDDIRNRDLAKALGAIVVAPEYRLAPEFPFPAAINDCYAGLTWLAASADDLGIDSTRIAITGNSAGGGLAAGTTLMARDKGGPEICFQLLTYPMLDDRNTTPSSYRIADSKVWSRASNLFAWDAYLGGASTSGDVSYYAAPARADDLSRLPATFISVGSADLFADEGMAYAQAVIRAGVMVDLHVYPGAFHGSDRFLPDSPLIQRWQADEIAAFQRAFNAAPPKTT